MWTTAESINLLKATTAQQDNVPFNNPYPEEDNAPFRNKNIQECLGQQKASSGDLVPKPSDPSDLIKYMWDVLESVRSTEARCTQGVSRVPVPKP